MVHSAPVNKVGHYCGRFAPGLLGEPQNSLSNLVFVIGAVYAWQVWRARGAGDR
jgi:predicted alpha/beta hydrolase